MTTATQTPEAAVGLQRVKAEIKTEISPTLRAAAEIEVNDARDAETAAEFMVQVERHRKMIEAKRKELKGPIDEAARRIQATFKEMLEPLEEARQIVEPKLLAWRRQEEERVAIERAAEQARLDEAREVEEARINAERIKAEQDLEAARIAASVAEGEQCDEAIQQIQEAEHAVEVAKNLEPEVVESAVVVPANIVHAASGSVVGRKTWEFEIEDESLIPREFLKVDEQAIRAYVRQHKGGAQIAGVRVYEKHSSAVKA